MDEEYNYRINLLLRDSYKRKAKSRISTDAAAKRHRKASKALALIRDEVSTPKRNIHSTIEANIFTSSNTPLLNKFFKNFPIVASQKENEDTNMLANISYTKKTIIEKNLTFSEKNTPQATILENKEYSMEAWVNTSSDDEKENVSETESDDQNTLLDGPLDQIKQTCRTEPRTYGCFKTKRPESMIIRNPFSQKKNQWENSSKLQIEEDGSFQKQHSSVLDNTNNYVSQYNFGPELGKCLEKSSNAFRFKRIKSSSTISSSSPQLDYGEKSDRIDQLDCRKEIQNTPETQSKSHNYTTDASVFKPATSTFNRNEENGGHYGKSLLSVDTVKRFQSSSKDITKMHFKERTKRIPNISKHIFRAENSPSLSQQQKFNFRKTNHIKKCLIFEDKDARKNVNKSEAFREFENIPAGKSESFNEPEQDRLQQACNFFAKSELKQQLPNKTGANIFGHMVRTKNSLSFPEDQQCNFQKLGHVKRRLFCEDREVNASDNFWKFENDLAGKSVRFNESKQDIPQPTCNCLEEKKIQILEQFVLNEKSDFKCKKTLQDQQPNKTSATRFENFNSVPKTANTEINNTQRFNKIGGHFPTSHKPADCPVMSKVAATCSANPEKDDWPPKFEETSAFLRKLFPRKTKPASPKLAALEVQPIAHCNTLNKGIDETAQQNNHEINSREMVDNAAASQMSQITQKTLFSSEGYETMPNSENLSNKPSDNSETQNYFKVNQFVDDDAKNSLQNANSKPVAPENMMMNVVTVKGNCNDDVKQRLSFQSPSTITSSLCDIQSASSQPKSKVGSNRNVPEISSVDTFQNENKPDLNTNFRSASYVEQHDNEPTTLKNNTTNNNNDSNILDSLINSLLYNVNMENPDDLKNDTFLMKMSNESNDKFGFVENHHDWLNFLYKQTAKFDHNGSSQPNMIQDNQIIFSQESRNCFSQVDHGAAQRNRRSKGYLPENCILYKDNLLKELLTEKGDILKSLCKNRQKIQISEEDEVLAKTYIKKYRKGDMRIFKIKRRLKAESNKQYQPPEEQIMDRFTEKARKDFRDDESLTNVEELESVASPKSYITDDTNLDVLLKSNESENLSQNQLKLREAIDEVYKDPTLLFSRYSEWAPKELHSSSILVQIQEVIIGILEDYENHKTPYFKLPRSRFHSNFIFKDERNQIIESPILKKIFFMNKRIKVNNKFNLMLFILNKIRILLETDTQLTKREIYYQLKTMVSSQNLIDEAVREISWLLKVGPWALNVTAQKGLVYGNLILVMDDAEILNCNISGTSVPNDVASICEIHSDAHFILVVEKESIFLKLIAEDLPKRLTRPFILITGKGYPDLNTQLFLKKLWMILSVPVFILVDADPDGISIMFNYRFGSMANAHISEYLAIPKARWIGVFPTEIRKLDLNEQCLNEREKKKVQSMLQMECVRKNPKIKEQLEYQLEHGVKAAIESVQKTETYLSNRYLTGKFYSKDFI